MFKRRLLVLSLLGFALSTAHAQPAAGNAKNVIVFLADAAGLPTLNAASSYGYGAPQKLYVQSWSHIALSDTSTASEWVTDSAAGMTAIVTGQKTNNGVLSQSSGAQRGKVDGDPLKTILEYAEERGLSTGVLTNVNFADATPAACYSHVNDRGKFGEIFTQLFHPRFGDGVDVAMGVGRKQISDSLQVSGKTFDQLTSESHRTIYASLDRIPSSENRPIAILERDLDMPRAAQIALDKLSGNPKGFFLMVEWDAHTDNPEKGLTNLVNFDKLIREIATKVNLKETLLLFTADHSFDLRVHDGLRTEPLLKGLAEWQKSGARGNLIDLPVIRMHDTHTGEEVLATAQGSGSEQLNGFIPNTRLFEIMMSAYGWSIEK